MNYYLGFEQSDGFVGRAAQQPFARCDPHDWQFYEPIVGAWFLALVTILALRSIYTRTFGRET